MYVLMFLVWAHWWNLSPTTVAFESYKNSDDCQQAAVMVVENYRKANTLEVNCTPMNGGLIYYGKEQ